MSTLLSAEYGPRTDCPIAEIAEHVPLIVDRCGRERCRVDFGLCRNGMDELQKLLEVLTGSCFAVRRRLLFSGLDDLQDFCKFGLSGGGEQVDFHKVDPLQSKTSHTTAQVPEFYEISLNGLSVNPR